MRLLITGAGGVVGQHLVRRMAAAGHEVVAAHHTLRAPVPGATSPLVQRVALDVGRTWEAIPDCDAVVHAAAATPLSAKKTPDEYLRVNAGGALKLLAYMERARPQAVVFLSSTSVYGHINSGVVDEATPLASPDLYGTTKFLAEIILLGGRPKACGVICLRLPGVMVPGDVRPWAGRVFEKAMRGEPITVFNPNSPFNSITSADQVADFVLSLFTGDADHSGVYNLAATAPMTVRKAATLIRDIAGSKSTVQAVQTRRGSYVLDTTKLQSTFGFIPATTREVLKRYALSCLEKA